MLEGYKWERDEYGWWVVEHDGMLRTGPFATQERGVAWFERELDTVIKAEQEAIS